MRKERSIRDQLIALGICDESSIEPYYPRVRDREDISVLRCRKSGVLFLSCSGHADVSFYREQRGFSYWSSRDRQQALALTVADTARRKKWLQHAVANRNWLDVGTGAGGILDAVAGLAARVEAVEPQASVRESLAQAGYQVYPDISGVRSSDFDIITLFHVFEHLTDPLAELQTLRAKLADNGRIVLEVPHANDVLLSLFDLESFKRFTFWSQHLILHTRASLARYLEKAGFREIVIRGCQRYPLANHLHWLARHASGGHEKWDFLSTDELDEAYGRMLASIDRTDTLLAFATRA